MSGLVRAEQGVAHDGEEVSPAGDDPAVDDAVHHELLGADPPSGRGDGAERPGVGAPSGEPRRDHLALDDEVLQRPLVVGEGSQHCANPVEEASLNPAWTKVGALVPAQERPAERLTLRMSFQTRKAVAEELKRRVGLTS